MHWIVSRKTRRDQNAHGSYAFFFFPWTKCLLSWAPLKRSRCSSKDYWCLQGQALFRWRQHKSSLTALNANNETSFYTSKRQGLNNFFITQRWSIPAYYLVKPPKAFRDTRTMRLTGILSLLFNLLFSYSLLQIQNFVDRHRTSFLTPLNLSHKETFCNKFILLNLYTSTYKAIYTPHRIQRLLKHTNLPSNSSRLFKGLEKTQQKAENLRKVFQRQLQNIQETNEWPVLEALLPFLQDCCGNITNKESPSSSAEFLLCCPCVVSSAQHTQTNH